MKKVILVTGPTKECGIFQYADSVFEILKTSKRYDFEFFATGSSEHFTNYVEETSPYAVIYNHHPWTLEWLNSGITRPLKNLKGLKQIVITGHEHFNQFTGVDDYIFTDPRVTSEDNKHSGIPPITYYDDIQYSPPKGPLKIGTSGFGSRTKSIPKIIGMINEQFTEDVILNLHISDGMYVDPTGGVSNRLVEECRKLIKSNVQMNVVRELLPKKDLITWLNSNDVNLYYYMTPDVLGVSGSVDRALAAKKPFGVNNNTLLSHTQRSFNDIDKVSIKDIVAGGIKPFQEFYDAWNPNKLLTLYEGLLDK